MFNEYVNKTLHTFDNDLFHMPSLSGSLDIVIRPKASYVSRGHSVVILCFIIYRYIYFSEICHHIISVFCIEWR
jgi:hypothetical protein